MSSSQQINAQGRISARGTGGTVAFWNESTLLVASSGGEEPWVTVDVRDTEHFDTAVDHLSRAIDLDGTGHETATQQTVELAKHGGIALLRIQLQGFVHQFIVVK